MSNEENIVKTKTLKELAIISKNCLEQMRMYLIKVEGIETQAEVSYILQMMQEIEHDARLMNITISTLGLTNTARKNMQRELGKGEDQ